MKDLIKTQYPLVSYIFILMLVSMNSFAKEESRPKSIGGDYVVEVNIGRFFQEDEEIFEAGFDLEYFLPGYHHHLSIGFTTEIEFEDEDRFFFAPLISYYYHHFKFFLASGISTRFHESEWKNKLGIGYEYFVDKDWILIPSIAYDRVNEENGISVAIGIGHEF